MNHGVDKRDYGIDLLKIVLACMIIIIHINAPATGQVVSHGVQWPWRQIENIITILCYPAVNIYIIITGYYLYRAHKNNKQVIRSLLQLWFSAVFFSVIGYFISVLYQYRSFDFYTLMLRFFPIIRGEWWFYTVYFALVLLSPYINKLIDILEQWEHKLLLIYVLLMLSVLPMFVDFQGQLGSNKGYSLIWFIALYATGAYLFRCRCMPFRKKMTKNCCFAGYLIASIIIYVCPWLLSHIGVEVIFAVYNSVFVYIQAVFLFIFFHKININNQLKKAVSAISPLALASYLFHCQEDLGVIIWDTFHPYTYANNFEIIFVSMGIVGGVLCISMLLELLRRYVINDHKVSEYVITHGKYFLIKSRLYQQ